MDVDWAQAFEGFLPSKYLFGASGLYTGQHPLFYFKRMVPYALPFPAVGILGATVMPHSLFLGSALATQDRLAMETPPPEPEPPRLADSKETTSNILETLRLRHLLKFLVSLFRTPPPSQSSTRVKRHADRENNSLAFIRAHLKHELFDVVGSLLGFAVLINSM